LPAGTCATAGTADASRDATRSLRIKEWPSG
jgi:hypothetical protein